MGRSVKLARSFATSLGSIAPLAKNPTRRAGFKVLKDPDVPSVLIELGYLSNDTDRTRLTSEEWLGRAADVLASAIDRDLIKVPGTAVQARLP